MNIDDYRPNLICCKMGRASKITVFAEEDFEKERAPLNSKIEHFEVKGKKYVRMTYTYN